MSEVNTELIRKYLLGRSDDTERQEFEQRLFSDESLYDSLLLQEDELTDEYVANELSSEDRQSFQSYFLGTPERDEKLRFAQNLHRYVNSTAKAQAVSVTDIGAPRTPFPSHRRSLLPQNQIARYALAATIVLAAATVVWILFSKQSQQRPEARNTVLVTLAPGVTRSDGETKVVQITPEVEDIRLQLLLPGDEHSSYRVQLISSEGGDVLHRENLQPITSEANKVLDFTIPADITERDDYQLKLAGRTPGGEYEGVATYYLRVLK